MYSRMSKYLLATQACFVCIVVVQLSGTGYTGEHALQPRVTRLTNLPLGAAPILHVCCSITHFGVVFRQTL